MIKVRGTLTVTAMSVLLLGGMVGPAMAQISDEVCGPYTGVACPFPEEPVDEVAPAEEEPSEVGGVLIVDTDPPETEQAVDTDVVADDGAVAASDEARVLGTVLARTGIDAWLLSLVGALMLSGGIAVLAVRRHRATDTVGR